MRIVDVDESGTYDMATLGEALRAITAPAEVQVLTRIAASAGQGR